MLRLTALILLFIGGLQGYGQDRKGYYQAEIGGGVTADRLPFWLHTNTFGKITNDTYLWGTVGVGTPFSKSNTRAFDYSFGFEGTGALGRKEHRIFIDQLHGFYLRNKGLWLLGLIVGLFDIYFYNWDVGILFSLF